MISKVPATQVVLSFATVSSSEAARPAVEAGLAGNLDPVSSFAELLALSLVKRAGPPIRRAVALQALVGAVAFLPALF